MIQYLWVVIMAATCLTPIVVAAVEFLRINR
jgi:hypothetical protein